MNIAKGRLCVCSGVRYVSLSLLLTSSNTVHWLHLPTFPLTLTCSTDCPYANWSSWTANSDKKYMKLNGAALNVNKPCVTSRKTAFPKDK